MEKFCAIGRLWGFSMPILKFSSNPSLSPLEGESPAIAQLPKAPASTFPGQVESRALRLLSLGDLRGQIVGPLYDPTDPEVKKASALIKPEDWRNLRPIDRDILGKQHIESAVDAFQKQYKDHEIVVVYSGAGVHGWLGVEALQRKGFAYIPAALQPLDGKVLDKNPGDDNRLELVKTQLVQNQRVLGALGYSSYAAYYDEKASSNLRGNGNVFIGLEETGLHAATLSRSDETGRGRAIYSDILSYVQERERAGKKVAVLVLGEGLDADAARDDFSKGRFRPQEVARDTLLSGLKRGNVSTGFAGVSYETSRPDSFFGPGSEDPSRSEDLFGL